MSARAKSGLVVVSLLGLAPLLACPPEVECESFNDCPIGQACEANACVPGNGDSSGGSGGGGGRPSPNPGDGGPLPNDTVDELQVEYPVLWLAKDPRGTGRVVFPEFFETGGSVVRDRLVSFDPAARSPTLREELDLMLLESPCSLEALLPLEAYTAYDEVWLACKRSPTLRIAYQGTLHQTVLPILGSAELAFLTTPEPGAYRRVLVAARGASTFLSYQLRDDQDGLETGHQTDALDASLSFTAIAGFFPLDRTGLEGDHVLVFDRSTPPRLVPIQRDTTGEIWRPSDTLEVFELPADTHAVYLLAPIRANNIPLDPNTPNFLTLEPKNGRIRFWNYEEAEEDDPYTVYETDPGFLVDAPAASERILLAPSPSGSHLFYALQTAGKIWRLPLAQGAESSVRAFQVDPISRRPSGLVPTSEDRVWVSYSNDDILQSVPVTP